MEPPCSERCPVYAMCLHRDAVNRFRVCEHFKDYVNHTINDAQDDCNEKHGKGKMTVVGVKIEGTQLLIDKNGKAL